MQHAQWNCYCMWNSRAKHATYTFNATHLPEVLIEAKEMILQNFDLFEYPGVHESASIHPQLNLRHR